MTTTEPALSGPLRPAEATNGVPASTGDTQEVPGGPEGASEPTQGPADDADCSRIGCVRTCADGINIMHTKPFRDHGPGTLPSLPWRVGSHAPRNLWVEDGSGQEGRGQDVGRMDTPELAAYVVACVNFRQEVDGQLAGAVDRLAEPLTEDDPGALYGRTLRAQVDRMEAEIHRLRIELVRVGEPGRTLEDVRRGARTALAVPR